MNFEYYHFPPKNFTPYDLRNMQKREQTYYHWKEFYEENKNIQSYDHVIKFWYLLDGHVEVGEVGISSRFVDLTLEMMEAIEKTETFCFWLPPHYTRKKDEAY